MKCPQCRQGDLFVKPGAFVLDGMANMHDNCPVCGLKFEQEPGFWWGAMYVSYALAVASALPTFILCYAIIGLSFWEAFAAIIVLQIILIPFVFRLARSIWIYMMGSYKSQS